MRSPSGLLSRFSSAMSDVRYWSGRVFANPRTFMLIGLIALIVFLFLFADTMQIAMTWAGAALGVLLLLWLCVYLWRRRRTRRANQQLGDMLEQQVQTGAAA
ncbi:hypothetical protein, partial [Achromobacter sp.]|uniref:hypothetical protein n=1 Tax=Achromobacter sp. TaxID=134375 RepID=UPI0031D2C28E